MEKDFPKTNTEYNPNDFYTPLEEAISEIRRRREDKELVGRVEEYLNGDIPEHFRREQPVLYLARHIATPNYEALRFIELAKPHGLPMIIGQDRKGKFVSHNELKKSLGKLPVTKGISRRLDEIVENFNVIDFTDAQGKAFHEITTKHGKDLTVFHNDLFKKVYESEVEIADEAEWIDRNYRENLFEHYKRMLAILCTKGIMFEYFTENELPFINQIWGPAFAEVEKELGCKPLIVEHITPEMELTRDWTGYPSVLYQYIKQDIEGV